MVAKIGGIRSDDVRAWIQRRGLDRLYIHILCKVKVALPWIVFNVAFGCLSRSLDLDMATFYCPEPIPDDSELPAKGKQTCF